MDSTHAAVLADETRRLLGDHWVENLHLTTRRPDLPAADERKAVREFLAAEVEAFDDRPYPNHPEYDGFHGYYDPNMDGEAVEMATFAAAVNGAQIVVRTDDTVALWSGERSDSGDGLGDPVVEVYRLADEPVLLTRTVAPAEPGHGLEDCLRSYSESPGMIDAPSGGDSPRVVDVDSPDDLGDDHRDAIHEVAYDEMRRVAGPHWVEELAAPRERGNGISVADAYCYEDPRAKDEFWPPTQANLRRFARADMAGTILSFDGQFSELHPDYDGFHDPNGVRESAASKFLRAVRDAEEIITVGDVTAFWDGRVNERDGHRITRHEQAEPDVGSALVYVYAPTEPGNPPEQVRHTGIETESRGELRTRLEEMAEDAADRWPRTPEE